MDGDGPGTRLGCSSRGQRNLLRQVLGGLLAVPCLGILVPPNYLASVGTLLALGLRSSVPRTLMVLSAYGAWMVLSHPWRQSVAAVGPDWLAALVQSTLELAMQGVGCTSEVFMEWQPEGDDPAQVVACYNPHGAFATGGICFAMGKWRLHPGLRRVNGTLVGASVLFYVPLLRELLMVLGVREANRETMHRLLSASKSIGMQPGGVWEQLHTDHRQERSFCMRNLGFIRLAMRHGLPLVPVYAFGENQLYTTWDFALGLRRALAERLRVGLPLISGAFGPFPLVPHPTHITLVSGRPVPVGPPNPAPSDDELWEVLVKYEAELQRIFEKYKSYALPPGVAQNGFTLVWRGNEGREFCGVAHVR